MRRLNELASTRDDTIRKINEIIGWLSNLNITYSADSISTQTGSYVSGDVNSIKTINDSDYYHVDEAASTPGFDIRIGFVGVVSFNTVRTNLYYSGSSLHLITIQLYNNTTASWDAIGQFSDLAVMTGMEFNVISPAVYVNEGVVLARIYHNSAGNASHDIHVDYFDIQHVLRGSAGPSGPAGSDGAPGSQGVPGVGVPAGGTTGQVLAKDSDTDYDTGWLALPEESMTVNYLLAEIDSAGTPQYFGYENDTGEWYISRNTSGVWRYAKGASNFSTAWTARASQTYDYPSITW